MDKKDFTDTSMRSKVFKLCLNAVILFIAIYMLVSVIVTLYSVNNGGIDPSAGNLPGAGILAAYVIAFASLIALIFVFFLSFIGLLCALIGIKRATNKVFKGIYIGFSCVYLIIMITSVIVLFT